MDSISIAFTYKAEDYTTFSVSVNSAYYSGKSSFCLPNSMISTAIDALSTINQALPGEYTIFDTDSDDFIQIIFKKQGHLSISGQLGGSYNENHLTYCFDTDQTALTKFIESLKRLTKS